MSGKIVKHRSTFLNLVTYTEVDLLFLTKVRFMLLLFLVLQVKCFMSWQHKLMYAVTTSIRLYFGR